MTPKETLDKAKVHLLMKQGTLFLSSISVMLEHKISTDVPTAATNGTYVKYNPDFFMGLTPEERVGLMAHEIFHVAFEHMVRRGTKDPQVWNMACISGQSSVKMADGTYKKLVDIVPGDYVDSPLGPNKVLEVLDKGIKKVGLLNQKLVCTPDHRILTNDGFKEAQDCTNRDIYVSRKT